TPSRIPQSSQLNVVYTTESRYYILHRRNVASKARFSSVAVNYQDIRWVNFVHNLYRMSRDDHLWMAPPNGPDESSLKVRMHVDVGLVQDYCFVISRSRQKPHRLQPHLKPVARPTDLSHEIVVPNMQFKF